MNHLTDIPLCESFDQFAWEPSEIRDLIRTNPLSFDDDGNSASYEAEQLFRMEAAHVE
jgi:hypothetical protein